MIQQIKIYTVNRSIKVSGYCLGWIWGRSKWEDSETIVVLLIFRLCLDLKMNLREWIWGIKSVKVELF